MTVEKKEVRKEVVAEERKPRRRSRRPFGKSIQKLSLSAGMQEYFDGRDEVVRWVNDEPGRLHEFTVDGDYRFVDRKELGLDSSEDATSHEGLGARMSKVVGTRDNGTPIVAYLLAEPKEFYEEDKRKKFEIGEEKMQAISQGIDAGGRPGDKEGRYIPKQGISISHK
jgi:hypothetical protein